MQTIEPLIAEQERAYLKKRVRLYIFMCISMVYIVVDIVYILIISLSKWNTRLILIQYINTLEVNIYKQNTNCMLFYTMQCPE